ncbi:MAG TPA: GNAT family N-acetyltransferase [Gemmatimonadales bacterium]|nr:GNAT family N-acetyltransferase [Gemmatimonadales bacterium]
MPVADLARALPDVPRWVETRATLLSGRAEVLGLSGDRRNFVVRSLREPLIGVVGRPEPPFIAEAAGRDPEAAVLVPEEHLDHVAAALPGWEAAGATIYEWPLGVPLPSPLEDPDVRPFAPHQDNLGHVPALLREELLRVSSWATVVMAVYAGGGPVSFCYDCSTTESLWDVSIDTLEPYRGRGFAVRAVREMIAQLARRGKSPVWGAADDNEPSRRLAAKLGFVPADRLAVFTRSGGSA